ncbi:hypothetical protein BU24DRAFT_405857 [Aaosphaeria arxii CBS 175.79]|uniref:MARVEL domain-containing protein n=1 Tax=Aaosphaeria arxii CBS 175.79 TaxID=1450172 RepID=A0A6A5Y1M1_9PLEO|nr:uncharacterized protein BU24DRAFT_405857 [Aaosphaeria arxii CBS 175.79]KAF2019149.1 hypothetical protein BU24DRAFT_405857 [Aaosphaeria arxii CBS 175.79]
MPPPAKKTGRDKRTTLAIIVACLVCGVPVAGTQLSLEITFFPDVPLKDSEAIINGPHIGMFAAVALSLICSIIVAAGSTILRHVSPNNGPVGITTLAAGVFNFAAQLIILALAYITNGLNPVRYSINDFRFVNGVYDTNGKQFTRETFACTMEKFHLDREPWSRNACSEYHYSRYCTILHVNTAFLLLGIAYWPVRKFLFGRNKEAAAVKA